MLSSPSTCPSYFPSHLEHPPCTDRRQTSSSRKPAMSQPITNAVTAVSWSGSSLYHLQQNQQNRAAVGQNTQKVGRITDNPACWCPSPPFLSPGESSSKKREARSTREARENSPCSLAAGDLRRESFPISSGGVFSSPGTRCDAAPWHFCRARTGAFQRLASFWGDLL